MALVLVVFGGIFLIPPEEDPALPQKIAVQDEEEIGVISPEKARELGIALMDARPGGAGTAGAKAGGAGQAGGAHRGDLLAERLEKAVIQACGQVPVNDAWSNNSVKRVLRVVRFAHKGNWREYLETCETRLRSVRDLAAQGTPVEVNGKVMDGPKPKNYVEEMIERIVYLRCAQKLAQTVK
ncbi:MAG: hypothetical protein VW268_04315 [Rhodospirillaceae bacterium]